MKRYICILVQAPKEVEYTKYEDRNLLIVLNSEKLADYNSGCCQEVRWSIYFFYPPPPLIYQVNGLKKSFETILMVVLVTICNCFL